MSTILQNRDLPIDLAKHVRHDLRSALDFLETSVRNLTGERPRAKEALQLYSVGTEKIRGVIQELDVQRRAEHVAVPAHEGVREKVFVSNHPEVVRWTQFFEDRVGTKKIFEQFELDCPPFSFQRARVVSAYWYRFSSFMPWFLCQASASVGSNERRHYVVQGAFEELGGRDVEKIHPEMFWEAVREMGVSEVDRDALILDPKGTSILDSLKQSLLCASSDDEIMGLLLGLEIPARENIEAVFRSLAHCSNLEEKVARSEFFKLHRQIESEHIRLAVSNFIRFCISDTQKEMFIFGFDTGVKFWEEFWRDVSRVTQNQIDLMQERRS